MSTVRPTVIALVGPTATGKTALSLALAGSMGAEIVACDSRTVYRGFDIGTAKPSRAEQDLIPHHLIDVADPSEDYTVSLYTRDAHDAIAAIHAAGRLTIVCGGTGFYARALLEGLVIPEVAPRPELRLSYQELADREGNAALHNCLAKIDPVSAARLNVNDRFRIVRALEVSTVLGMPFSQAATRTEPPYHTIWIGLTAENRSYLTESIRKRFYAQMDAGMLAEVETLLARYGAGGKLASTVNYKQLVEYLAGCISLDEAAQLAIRHNCQLSRRQSAWFAANPLIKWFAVDQLAGAELISAVEQYIKSGID